jgi:serine/threonine protein kinase/Tfp pilus assembly protein PilF
MNACGISDSMADMLHDPAACAKCGSMVRVGHDVCANCLLQSGLTVVDDESSSLDSVLAEVNVQDADWRIGNYQILEEIGRGGMGVIYRARQRHSRRIVALKRILSFHADSRDTLARFRREAEAAASLDHPNILPIYEVSEGEDGLPFFSMKFAPGGSLLDVSPALRDEPRRSVALMAKVAHAVQYAHSQGILHRDLKPGNIMLDGRGEPLVSDFGLAKWLDTTSDLTRTLTIFGTPGYIAPEQARGPAAKLTSAADVYSLGAILFDLFTGRPPFLGEHALDVIQQAAEKSAPKLQSLAPRLDRDLETICARCLEREPRARYRSAGDLAKDLERWLEGRPIIARPVSPPVRIWRWSKRNPKLAGSIAACLVLGIAAGIWQVQSQRLEGTVRQEELARHSIAVLPFLDLDAVQRDQKLTNSIAGSLQANLSQSGPARIVPVSRPEAWLAGAGSLQDIKEANDNIKARAVLTGARRLVNGKLRISMRLMNAATGDILLTRVLDLVPSSSDIAETIRTSVSAIWSILDAKDWSTISPKARDPGMRNPAAREFIVSGRQLMLRSSVGDMDKVDKSIRCFEKALELEPSSAVAHAYLASAFGARLHFTPNAHFLEQSEKEAREALRLEPDSPDAHRALAGIFYNTGNLSEALEQALLAVEAQGPEERVSNLLGMTLQAMGQPGRALGWLDMAKHLASLPGDYDPIIGDCWTLLSDDQRAEEAYRRAINLRPESPDGWVGLCHLQLLRGNFDAARQLCRENYDRLKNYTDPNMDPRQIIAQIEFFARNYDEAEKRYSELAKTDPSGGGIFYGGISYNSALGRLQQLHHDEKSSRELLQACLENEAATVKREPQNRDAWYQLAAVESCLGKTDAAVDHLTAAIKTGWIDARSPKLDPRFDGIAGDPRFQQIITTLTNKVTELRRQVGQPTTMASNGENNSP